MKMIASLLLCLPFLASAHEHGKIPADIAKSSIYQSVLSVYDQAAGEVSRLTGRPAPGAFYGVSARTQGQEVEGRLHYVPQPGFLNDLIFDCHLHGGHFDCHAAELAEARPFAMRSPTYDVEIFETATLEAFGLFHRRVSPVSTLEAVSFWQSGDSVQAVFNYRKNGKTLQTNMMCHQHDADHFDCHRQIDPGAGRP